jgi:hypothetical protein
MLNNLSSFEDFVFESKKFFTEKQINESLIFLGEVEDPAILEAWYNTILDFAALIPGIGSIAEGINLVSYAKQGEYLLSALCAIGLIPIFGQYIGAGGTLLVKALGKGTTLGKNILKPLINAVAKFFPKITAFLKSPAFLSKFSGIAPFVGKMLASLKRFVTGGGKTLETIAKNPAKLKAMQREIRNVKLGIKIPKAVFGGGSKEEMGEKIPVPKDAYFSYQGGPLQNIRPYTDMEISGAETEDWTRYLIK